MSHYVALIMDYDDCVPKGLLVHEDLKALQDLCAQAYNGDGFEWASCPGGRDPEVPVHLSPISYSINKETGQEAEWEIYEAEEIQ